MKSVTTLLFSFWLNILLFSQLTFVSVTVTSQSPLCQILDDGVTDCSNKMLTYVPRDLPPATRQL